MLEKCQECYGFIVSSCCCALAEAISKEFDKFQITDFWISDIKYDYPESSNLVIENIVVCENIGLK